MARENKDVVAALFRELAEAINRLESDDWVAVLAGNFTVDIQVNGRPSHHQHGRKNGLIPPDFIGIQQALNDAQTRQAALNLLKERCRSKEGLLQLSRFLDLPAHKRESIEKLQERIIEGTVGFRLRSRAVQGEPLPAPINSSPTVPVTPDSGTDKNGASN